MEHPNQLSMLAAIRQARFAAECGQYPLGAVVSDGAGEIISIGHTTIHCENDPTAHAEMNVIRVAARRLGTRYLTGLWLYTTQEPCPMCVSAAIWAKMEGIVFGATKDDALEIYRSRIGREFSWRQIDIAAKDITERGVPRVRVIEGYLRDKCVHLYDLTKSATA